MKKGILALIALAFAACQPEGHFVSSPDGAIQVQVDLGATGALEYAVRFDGEELVEKSKLGFDFANAEDLFEGFKVKTIDVQKVEETYTMQWGANETIKAESNEMTMRVVQTETGRELGIIFRVSNDGYAFRYDIPAMEEGELIVANERSEFNLASDAMAHWIPGDWEIYEHPVNHTRISEINALSKANHPNLAATHIVENSVSTPVTFVFDSGTHMSIHEAALVNYSGMTLKKTGETSFVSSLVGRADGNKATIPTPFKTPWRMAVIGDEATDLLASHFMYDLNEPNVMGDITDWFKPQKYVGIWWESTWARAHGITV